MMPERQQSPLYADRGNHAAGNVAGTSVNGGVQPGKSLGSDPYDLARFIDAQEGVYEQALDELRAGRKESHWMWFIFPQFEGLGVSATSRRYAIRSMDEARAYLSHPVLGARLSESTEVVNGLQELTAREIFGDPDDRKFRSSMTLFELVASAGSPFASALEKYFSGERDARTIELVRLASDAGR